MILDREEIVEKLTNDIAHISWTKVNGDSAEMYITLRSDILPPPKPIVENVDENDALKKPKKVNLNLFTCWSVNSNAWRSFKIDALKTFNILTEDDANALLESVAKNV